MHYVTQSNFHALLDALAESYEVYVPVKKVSHRLYEKHSGSTENVVVGEVRAVEPLKAFFFLAREQVAEGFEAAAPGAAAKPACIVGVKACDLKGFKVQDSVFAEEDPDPFYVRVRKRNLIIAADCTCALDTCFCLALGVEPHPQDGYDLNLSAVNGGFLVEVGSEKGRQVVDAQSSFFEEARDDAVTKRDAQRARVAAEVQQNLAEQELPDQSRFEGIIERNFDAPIWADEAAACVECGACNTICPTCHCFLLYDQQDAQRMARFRMWDSCMVKDFARVAGGGNPREALWMRLRNRFEKKFDFFPKRAGIYACTGCGRCIAACPAKIDIRNVLKRLVAQG